MGEPGGASADSGDDVDLGAVVRFVAGAAAAKTDEPTVVLDVGEVLSITDWFVITGGRNDRQVKAVVDEVESRVRTEHGLKPRRIEGVDTLSWVLMDYGPFVVHVLGSEARAHYDLERLWGDVPRVDWS